MTARIRTLIRHHYFWWLTLGAVLLVLQGLVVWLSPHFRYERSAAYMPVLWFATLLILAAIVFLFLPALVRRSAPSRSLMLWIFALGLIYRLCMFPSTPILEDDFYRYLWDGGVTSEGINPYRYAPGQARQGEGPIELSGLAGSTPLIVERVNHPHLTTVYPPTAQAGFVLAHWLKPWSLGAWRAVLLAADVVTLCLLLALLGHAGRSYLWSALYWWNPLVVKELFNSAHVDGLLLPLLLGVLLLTLKRRAFSACGCLALAAGIKVRPVLLLPLVLKAACDRVQLRLLAAGLFLGLVAILAGPMVVAGLSEADGFVAYSQRWEMNDALFMSIAWGVHRLFLLAELTQEQSGLLARFVVGTLVLIIVGLMTRKHLTDFHELTLAFLVVIAAVFLLSPAQFPWYYTWLVPLLAIQPRLSLLLLTPLLCVYYTRFYFEARGQAAWFDFGLVWLEYIPVWLLLIREWLQPAPFSRLEYSRAS